MENVEMEFRDIKDIVADIKGLRVEQAKIEWPVSEIIADMTVLAGALIVDSRKYQTTGNKSAAKRVRDYTKCLETLGLGFRKQSV